MALTPWQATVQNDEGQPVINPTITVRIQSDNSLAEIYSDADGASPLPNPFDGGLDGFVRFYAAPGRYIVQGADGGTDAPDWVVDMMPVDVVTYASRAAFEDAIVPAPLMRWAVMYNGRALPYVRDASATAIESANGIKGAPDGTATPEHYGWSSASSSEAQTAACKTALEAGHGSFEFSYGETYLVDLLDATITAPMSLSIKGTIKGSDSPDFITSIVFRLRSDTTNRYPVSVDGFNTGTIDATLRSVILGEGSGSGFCLRLTDNSTVQRLRFYSGEDGQSGFGDSGLVPEYCRNLVVDSCSFKGWNDHGIYATGGPADVSSLIANDLIVTNCHFEQCEAGAVRLSRDLRTATVDGNIFVNCGKGVINGGGQTNFKSAEKIIISNNIANNCHNSVFDIRFTHAKTSVQIIGNQIYGFSTEIGNPAINLRGVSNSITADNYVDFNDTATGGTTGIYIVSALGDDGVFYTAANNVVHGNTIRIREQGITGVGTTVANNKCIVDLPGTAKIYDNNLNNAYPYDIYTGIDGSDTSLSNPNVRRVTATGVGFNGAIPRAPMQVGDKMRISRSHVTAPGVYDYGIPDTQYMEIIYNSGGVLFDTISPVANAKGVFYDASTATDAAPTGGSLFHTFRINGAATATFDQTGAFGIGTTTPAASALLDMTSTTRGFLPPRMSTTARNAIASPADGLVIYNISEGRLNVRENGVWNSMNKRTLPTYADNAAALSGGLTVGVEYKTATGEVRVVV